MMSNYEQELVWEIHSAKEAIRILASQEQKNKKWIQAETLKIPGENLANIEEKAISLSDKYKKMAPAGMSFSELYFHLEVEMETWYAYGIPTVEILDKKILEAMNYLTEDSSVSFEALENFDDLEGLDYDVSANLAYKT